jgi:hypothetical protein
MTGHVKIYANPTSRILPRTDPRLRLLFEGDNLVTELGLQVLAALASGCAGDPTIDGTTYTSANRNQLFVTTMKVGTANNPTAANTADTDLYDSDPYIVTTLTVTYPEPGTVRFAALAPGSAGEKLTEDGLFTASGILVARKVFSQTVPDGVVLQIEHDLTVGPCPT